MTRTETPQRNSSRPSSELWSGVPSEHWGKRVSAAGLCARGQRVEAPMAWDAFELVGAAVNEAQARTRGEILDGLGDEHLAGVGECGDASAGNNRDARKFFSHDFALARMDSSPDGEVEFFGSAHDRPRTCHRAGRT